MLFPTFTFILVFLPITIIVYYLLAPKSSQIARLWLIGASLVFYSWFNWSYFFILAGSIAMNRIFSIYLEKRKSKTVFILGIFANLLLLGYFKYYDFFIENINYLFNTSWTLKNILLPLGISFFTFQQISYLQQVYERTLEKHYSLSTYSLFVCFFPQLIAGPIVLPDEMMSQFDKEENYKPNSINIATGLYVFAIGMAKKILLADFFAEIADKGFANISTNFFDSWICALSYMFQIYFDFSGYCDMAIGIALLFNIKLPVNFDAPYKSENITVFWRRWHITLGRFLMSSIYIPLGGNRKGNFRTYCNLIITFFISGLWHGASWLFVLWGMLHGAGLVIHRVWSKHFNFSMPAILGRIITFLFVLIAWVPFRAQNLTQVKNLYKGMFLPQSWSIPKFDLDSFLLFITGFIVICCLPSVSKVTEKFRPTIVNFIITATLITVSMFFFVKYSPFIYFNF